MAQEEKVPLLIPSPQAPSPLYPAFVPPRGYPLPPPPPPYTATETYRPYYGTPMPTPEHSPRQPRGYTSLSIGGLIAIGIALVILFSVVYISHNKHKYINSPILRQSAGGAGYKDISIPQGMLRGFTRKSRQGRDFTAYYKVPYAEPPLGEFRFKDPIAPQGGWDGVRAISEIAPQCIQKEKYSDVVHAVGEEDCLHANIYVPEVFHEDPLPVMVYIHGGGFTDGNGSRYGPEYFMDEDVIVITFQYRLGAFGFLNSGDDVIRGNMGFKDQVQMLKWTRDNIHHFGGDPQRVTIYGNSAGGMSVSFLMLSPMANGLFHRAITQSGASICANLDNVVFDKSPEVTLREVERELGCDANDTSKFLECLRTKPAADVALVRTPKTRYGLTVETRNDDQVFMPDNPYVVARDSPNRVPYIVGVVNAEWIPLALGVLNDERFVQELNRDWSGYAMQMFNGANMTKAELDSVRDFYFGEKAIGNETLREMIALTSDRGLIHCSYVSAKLHGKYSPTYLYYVSKPPYKSYAEKAQPDFPAKEMGLLSHADELQFIFLYDGYPEIKMGDEEYFEFSKFMVKTWATFARDGKPQEEWQRATNGEEDKDVFWFELNDKPGRTEVIRENMEFWDGFTHEQLGYAG